MAHRYLSTTEQNLVLSKLAAYLMGYLAPEGFTYKPPTGDSWQHYLTGPDEAKIYLRLEGDTKGDRVHIDGSFHIGKDRFGNSGVYVRPDNHPGSISVALSRGDKVIAREIENRYLPKYLAALAQARQKRDAEQAYHKEKLSNMQKLCNLAGDMRTLAYDTEQAYIHIGEVYGKVSATPTSASVELHCLTMAQAEAIIKLLKETA